MTPPRTSRPEPLKVRLAAALAAALVAAALLASGWTWRLDAWVYDFILDHWGRNPDSATVIVAIDDKSVAEIGAWPWSRRVHAELLTRLTEVGVRGVALDLVLAEPNAHDPAGDDLLAKAIAENGRVVMPVLAGSSRPGGPLVEVMPLPAITGAVAALGHTDVGRDRDGVTRGVYLRAGVGSPHWPVLALALLELDPARTVDRPDGLRNAHPEEASPYHWVRDNFVRIPFAGPNGTFGRVSYVDVLRDDATLELLRDRWVLVGVTLQGLGERLQVPVAQDGPRMQGVEVQANILDTLDRGLAIRPLTLGWQLAIMSLLILLPALLCGVPGFRSPRTTAVSSALLSLLASVLLLRLYRVWFPPATVVVVFAIGYVVWTMGYTRRWRKEAGSDPLTQLANRRRFDIYLEQELLAARRVHRPLSLLLIDVDCFKQYNDSYGHRPGDEVLRQVGRVIAEHARRPRDLAARLGGDEFALVLPETHAGGAALVADALHADIRALNISHQASPVVERVSISIGIHTCVPDAVMACDQIYEGADSALYKAKRQGRNRTERLTLPAAAGSHALGDTA